jgi:hypothetical protein
LAKNRGRESKGFVEDLVAFAESFRLSAKPGFLVVRGPFRCSKIKADDAIVLLN